MYFDYNTELTPSEETGYVMWLMQMKKDGKIHPDDHGADYDYKGLYKELSEQGALDKFSAETHFPDTYKKPNHETFSKESIYATGDNAVYAGNWIDGKFIEPMLKYGASVISDVLRGGQ